MQLLKAERYGAWLNIKGVEMRRKKNIERIIKQEFILSEYGKEMKMIKRC